MTAELEHRFPKLKSSSYKLTSPKTRSYNCIAWAAGDPSRWWWPALPAYWPPGVMRECTMAAFIHAYGTLGYTPCDDGGVEIGYEKVAIYVDSNGVPTHAARQLSNGHWTSKLGGLEDIQHELGGIEGTSYGRVGQHLRRPLKR